MGTSARQLDEILTRFDGQSAPFEEIEIADAIRALVRERGKGAPPTFCELAEETAFGFAVTTSNGPSRCPGRAQRAGRGQPGVSRAMHADGFPKA